MNKTFDSYLRIAVVSVLTVWFVALCIYYISAYQYHFYWHEQNQLFLHTSDYLSSYLQRPAWLACMAGDYLTQFYYYRYAGPAILTAVLAATIIALYICLRRMLPGWLIGLVLIAATVWLTMCTFGASYKLSSLLCVTGGLLSFLLLRQIRVCGPLLIPVVFVLFGYGWSITLLLYALFLIKKPSKWTYLTLIISSVFTLVMIKGKYDMRYSDILAYPGIGMPHMPERTFEQTLAVDNEYYFGNLDEAIARAKDMDNPNEISSFYYYLSQARKNALPDSLLSYPVRDLGTLQKIGEETPVHIINMMNELYYQLGDMTYTERAAMMRNVFSTQNRNVRMIKRLAEANLVSGDTLAAIKYLRILSNTHAYSHWAECRIPGFMPEPIEHDIKRRQNQRNTQSDLRLGDNCRTILIQLLDSNPDNIIALDYLLCTDLLLKEMDTFKQDYDRYCTDRGKHRIKPLYQQALMIYLAGTDAPEEEWNKYILMPDQLQRFISYNRQRGNREFSDTYWYYFDTHK